MKAIDELRGEVQKNFSLDRVVDSIALKIRECFLRDIFIEDNYEYLGVMYKTGLAEQRSTDGNPLRREVHPAITEKARELYKKLDIEDYYSKQTA